MVVRVLSVVFVCAIGEGPSIWSQICWLKAGMQKIAVQPPPKEALKIAETLSQLGFNTQLLGSEKYVLSKLQTLSDERVVKIRGAFIRNSHARFMKYFFPHQLFGKREAYTKETRTTSLERLARLIKVCGFLMQTKVYLFWMGIQKEE